VTVEAFDGVVKRALAWLQPDDAGTLPSQIHDDAPEVDRISATRRVETVARYQSVNVYAVFGSTETGLNHHLPSPLA
jgi:hypothetical protein